MDDISDLTARLTRLEAVERARGATYRYATAVDARDVDALTATVFAPAARLHARGREASGTDEIAAFYRDALTRAPGLRRHFLTNQVAEALDEHGALVRVQSYFRFLGCDETSSIGWGRYEDVVDTTGETAVIVDKTIHLDVRTDLDGGWAGAGSGAG